MSVVPLAMFFLYITFPTLFYDLLGSNSLYILEVKTKTELTSTVDDDRERERKRSPTDQASAGSKAQVNGYIRTGQPLFMHISLSLFNIHDSYEK